jgi:RluA family pseudouridine synthase
LEQRNAKIMSMSRPLPGSQPYDNYRPINIPERLQGRTLWECALELYSHVPPQQWEEWFRAGQILAAGEPARKCRRVRSGEQFWHWFPQTVEPDVNANIRVIWEDDDLIAVNKPAPLPVHPCGRFNRNTLTSLLSLAYAEERLCPVHRLDANTTGVLLLARTKAAATFLRQQFEQNRIIKRYLVRTVGWPECETVRCDQPISRVCSQAGARCIDPTGLAATTHFRLLRRLSDGSALVEAMPHSGRTNQIRVHLWSMGLPVLGDPLYLADGTIGTMSTHSLDSPCMCLHARSVSLTHPHSPESSDESARLQLIADPPNWGWVSSDDS